MMRVRRDVATDRGVALETTPVAAQGRLDIPRGSPPCMSWHEMQVRSVRACSFDISRPWYSYAVSRGVPSFQKRRLRSTPASSVWAPIGNVN